MWWYFRSRWFFLATIAGLVLLAAIISWLSPFFRDEWTLWVALAAMLVGIVIVRRRGKR
jgi:hypothetical protein